MKVYEKLGLPYLTEAQIKTIDWLCPACINGVSCSESPDYCPRCVYEYLNSDVPTKKVKRWETYNGDFLKADEDFWEFCNSEVCASCPTHPVYDENCFARWLMEEIEVAE